jgi:hypothetical protein
VWTDRAKTWLAEQLAPERAALDLAVFRITIAATIANSASVMVAERWASLPEEVRSAPLGVGWLLPHLPIDPDLVHAAKLVLFAACACGAIGLFSRASFAIVAICTSYVLLVPQLGGAVFHDHHLLWFAILLAASPCGDALSVDAHLAKRRGAPPPTHGRAHGAAVRTAWILLGLVFFFPGVHKLAESGLDWIFSDNLRNQLWWKWAMNPSLEPSLRIDRHPILLRALAAATIAFELSFLPLVFWRRTRALAVLGALVFHQATDYFMGIHFAVLFVCYTVFVPWEAVVQKLGWKIAFRSEPERSTAPVSITSAALVLAVGIAGALGATQAYPFACYPTFEWIVLDRMPGLAIEIERAGGEREDIDRALYMDAGPRGWALEWRLAGVYDGVDRARIEAWWRQTSARPALRERIAAARSIRFHRVSRSVDPDHRGEERSRRPILTLRN